MKLRERPQVILKLFKDNSDKSIRTASTESGIPKSSVHREQKYQQERIEKTGHDFFETEIGFGWLWKLFYGVIFVFGIRAHVGSGIISQSKLTSSEILFFPVLSF